MLTFRVPQSSSTMSTRPKPLLTAGCTPPVRQYFTPMVCPISQPAIVSLSAGAKPNFALAGVSSATTGLRSYNPKFGRWINRDPIGEDWSVNLACFLANSPTRSVDVLGMISSEYYDVEFVPGVPEKAVTQPLAVMASCKCVCDREKRWHPTCKPVTVPKPTIKIDKSFENSAQILKGLFGHEFMHIRNNWQFANDLAAALVTCPAQAQSCESKEECKEKYVDHWNRNLNYYMGKFSERESAHRNFAHPKGSTLYYPPNQAAPTGPPGWTWMQAPPLGGNPMAEYEMPIASLLCGTTIAPVTAP